MRPTRLPDQPARLVLASGEYPDLIQALRSYGFEVIATKADERLPGPVRWHPDMQACPVGGELFVLREGTLITAAADQGITVRETSDMPTKVYPGDVLCNGLAWDKHFMVNPNTIDTSILKHADSLGMSKITVKQGYAACSTALVDSYSAITADPGVADALEANNIDVLRVEPGYIKLPDYDYGLFGGCCGKLAPNLMAFAGQLESHPDGARIKNYLRLRGVEVLELMEGPLWDVGGIMALA